MYSDLPGWFQENAEQLGRVFHAFGMDNGPAEYFWREALDALAVVA
jgi:hypothetical protein